MAMLQLAQAGEWVSSNGSMDEYYVEDDSSKKDANTVTTETTETAATTETTSTTPTTTPTTVKTTETPNTTTTTTTSPTTTSTLGCGAAWAQCGGADFEGSSCCQPGLSCVSVNAYWARCVAPSLVSSAASMSSSSSSSGSKSTTHSTVSTGGAPGLACNNHDIWRVSPWWSAALLLV